MVYGEKRKCNPQILILMAFGGRKPKPMNELLKEFMKSLPDKAELKRGMVLHFWPSVVGEQIAGITKTLNFKGRKLIVTVENEAWRYELHSSRYSIAKKLNQKVGSDVVEEIIVRT